MATELDVATAPSASFSQEEMERIRQYEKIVKLSETITSGNHPRIKIPASRVVSGRSTGSPAFASSTTAPAGKAGQQINGSAAYNERAHNANSQLPAVVASAAALPGLGPAPMDTDPAEQLSGFALQRARLEAQLKEQASQPAKPEPDESADFLVDQVLQKARQLEKLFTPPPMAQSDMTVAGKKAPSSAPADSGDDETFYSSKFNTPESGLAARIPLPADKEDACMADSSDYEPELDTAPSPQPAVQQPQQPQQVQPPQQQLNPAADPFAHMSSEAATQILQSLVALQAQNSTQPVPIPPPSLPGNNSSSNNTKQQQAWQSNSTAPQVVRTHDLSPVAPQPEHISALTVETRLGDGQRGGYAGAATNMAVPQSGSDSSPQFGGRAADRKKGKKKNAMGKRKVDTAPTSPRIKSEPRSASPMAAPPIRPFKRQRQNTRPAPAPAPASVSATSTAPAPAPASGPVAPAEYLYEDQYNPALQGGHRESHARYGTARIVSDSRAPVVYERVDRGYDTYEPVAANYPPRHVQPSYHAPSRPASTVYAQPPRGAYLAGHELSGRVSVRPDALERGRPRSPEMAPPAGRILVDEYNREYFEPARPPAVVATGPFDPSMVYDRPAAHQRYAAAPQRFARVESRVPAVYGDDEVVYQRTSPAFAPAQHGIAQPEYVTREYVDYAPQREYSVRPGQYASAPQAEHGHGGFALEERPPASVPPPREYLVRAATTRPSEAPRYDVPPLARYVERVGSVRPPENSRGGGVAYGAAVGGPLGYDGQMRPPGVAQHVAEGAYVEGHHGQELVRPYSVRPEPHVVAPRDFSTRAAGPPLSSAPMAEGPYYAEEPMPPLNRPPPQEYVYADGSVPRDLYR